MESGTADQTKHERSRIRWTPSYDRIFADLVVKHIQQGNRPNNFIDKKTWNSIRDGFNKQTGLSFNNNQLRKHLDVLRTRFYNLKSATVQNHFPMEDPGCIRFDLWEDVEAHPRSETVKVKDCPIFEQLCTIFTETLADGQYAQSSHFEGLEKSIGNNAAGSVPCPESTDHNPENTSSRIVQQHMLSSEKGLKCSAERKRKRLSETNPSEHNGLDENTCEAMAEALLEMVAASKQRNLARVQHDDKFSISNCIKALDEVGDIIDQQFYLAALDLFEDSALRETFISLRGIEIRLAWLQGKCGRVTMPMYAAEDVVPFQSAKAFSAAEIHPSSLFIFPQLL